MKTPPWGRWRLHIRTSKPGRGGLPSPAGARALGSIYQNFNKALKSSVISKVQPVRVFRRISLTMDCSMKVLCYSHSTFLCARQAPAGLFVAPNPDEATGNRGSARSAGSSGTCNSGFSVVARTIVVRRPDQASLWVVQLRAVSTRKAMRPNFVAPDWLQWASPAFTSR